MAAKVVQNEELETYRNLGNACLASGEYSEAVQHYEKCLNIVIEMGDKAKEGSFNGLLGIIFKTLGRYDKAMQHHEKQLDVAIKMGDREKEGFSYGEVGSIYHALGDYYTAIEYYQKNLDIAVEIKDREEEGAAYAKLGNSYQSLGKYHEAMDNHKKCLDIAIETSDMEGQAVAYSGLGADCMLLGKYHQAIEYHKKSLEISLQLGDEEYEQAAYGNLGIAYHSLGKFVESIDSHKKDLDIAIKIGNREGEGAACGNLGMVYQSLGKFETAAEYYERSLNIAEEIGDKCGEATASGNVGVAYDALGRHEEAIEYYKKCLSISTMIGDRKGQGVAYANLASDNQSLKKYQEAIEYHGKHISITVEISDKKGEGQGYFQFGLCYMKKHKEDKASDCGCNCMTEARYHFTKCIECYETLFDDLELDQDKISIVDTFDRAYKLLALVYIETQQMDEALLVSERGKARALKDLLNLKYKIDKETTATSLQTSDVKLFLSTCNFCIVFYSLHPYELVTQIWILTNKDPTVLVKSETKVKESTDTKEELDNMKELQTIGTLVEKSYDSMKVREGVDCEDRSVMPPLETEVDHVEEEPAASGALSQSQSAFAQNSGARSIEDTDDNQKPLELLYDRLVAPVQHKLVQDEIVIIPDGRLFMVPFAALQDPETGKFLSETKRIRLSPSLTTLKVLQESSKDHHNESGALIVGNPKIGRVKYEGCEKLFKNLPGAEDEAEKIGQLLGVEPLTGQKATKESIVQKLQVGVSVIHFAAHGSTNGQIFLAPSVLSATDNIPDEQDYILTMKEAQESGIRAQLVVLSCCHSGRGEIKAEGVVGMSRAFLAAGARAVVASLWAIDDDATEVFMLKFYSHLKRGESASKSLQQAMKDMRETTRYKEPKYWAAFFLIGDDVTISI